MCEHTRLSCVTLPQVPSGAGRGLIPSGGAEPGPHVGPGDAAVLQGHFSLVAIPAVRFRLPSGHGAPEGYNTRDALPLPGESAGSLAGDPSPRLLLDTRRESRPGKAAAARPSLDHSRAAAAEQPHLHCRGAFPVAARRAERRGRLGRRARAAAPAPPAAAGPSGAGRERGWPRACGAAEPGAAARRRPRSRAGSARAAGDWEAGAGSGWSTGDPIMAPFIPRWWPASRAESGWDSSAA